MAHGRSTMIMDMTPLIFPTDLKRAVQFYTDVLGFVEAYVGEDFAELKSGNQTLILHADKGLDDKAYEQELHGHKRGVGVNLAFEVTDVGRYYKRIVEEAGAPLEQELAPTPWGTRRFTVRDPDGVHLSFFSYE